MDEEEGRMLARVTQKLVRIQCPENLRVPTQGSSTEGESGPMIRPKGVVDGQLVNIHVLPLINPEGQRMLGYPKDGYRFNNIRCP